MQLTGLMAMTFLRGEKGSRDDYVTNFFTFLEIWVDQGDYCETITE